MNLRPVLVAALAVALPSGIGACAGTQPAAQAPVEGLTPVDQLPQPQRDLLAAYGEGGEAWSRARAAALADPALARFLVDNLVLEMLRAWDAYTRLQSDESIRACRRAQDELARMPEHSVPVVVEMLRINDGVAALMAAETLRKTGHPAALPVTRMLEDPDARVRRKAASVLGGLPNSGSGEGEVRGTLTRVAVADPEWIVRAQAATALGERGSHDRETSPWRVALERLLNDPDLLVVEAAVKALALLGDPLAIPALARSLESAIRLGNLPLVRACGDALTKLSGTDQRLDPEGWRRWWSQNAKRFLRTQTPAGPRKP